MDSTESYSNNEEPDGLDKAIKVLDFLSNTAKQVEEGINDSLNNQYLKCYSCDGTGSCTSCKGVGKKYGGQCAVCRGAGTCTSCGGDGNLY